MSQIIIGSSGISNAFKQDFSLTQGKSLSNNIKGFQEQQVDGEYQIIESNSSQPLILQAIKTDNDIQKSPNKIVSHSSMVTQQFNQIFVPIKTQNSFVPTSVALQDNQNDEFSNNENEQEQAIQHHMPSSLSSYLQFSKQNYSKLPSEKFSKKTFSIQNSYIVNHDQKDKKELTSQNSLQNTQDLQFQQNISQQSQLSSNILNLTQVNCNNLNIKQNSVIHVDLQVSAASQQQSVDHSVSQKQEVEITQKSDKDNLSSKNVLQSLKSNRQSVIQIQDNSLQQSSKSQNKEVEDISKIDQISKIEEISKIEGQISNRIEDENASKSQYKFFDENEKSEDFFQDFENEEDLDVNQIVEIVKTFTSAQQLDVCAWGSSTLYNEMYTVDSQENDDEQSYSDLPFKDDKLIIAVGNSKLIWEAVQDISHLHDNQNDIFESYSKEISIKLKTILQNEYDLDVQILYFNHKSVEENDQIFIEKYVLSLTEGDGADCCFLEDCNLFFHKKFGNWFQWRFALVFNNVPFQSSEDIFEILQTKELILNELISQDEQEKAKALCEQNSENELKIKQVFEIGKKDWMFCEEMLNCFYKPYNDDESYNSDQKESEIEKQEYSNEQFDETNAQNQSENSQEIQNKILKSNDQQTKNQKVNTSDSYTNISEAVVIKQSSRRLEDDQQGNPLYINEINHLDQDLVSSKKNKFTKDNQLSLTNTNFQKISSLKDSQAEQVMFNKNEMMQSINDKQVFSHENINFNKLQNEQISTNYKKMQTTKIVSDSVSNVSILTKNMINKQFVVKQQNYQTNQSQNERKQQDQHQSKYQTLETKKLNQGSQALKYQFINKKQNNQNSSINQFSQYNQKINHALSDVGYSNNDVKSISNKYKFSKDVIKEVNNINESLRGQDLSQENEEAIGQQLVFNTQKSLQEKRQVQNVQSMRKKNIKFPQKAINKNKQQIQSQTDQLQNQLQFKITSNDNSNIEIDEQRQQETQSGNLPMSMKQKYSTLISKSQIQMQQYQRESSFMNLRKNQQPFHQPFTNTNQIKNDESENMSQNICVQDFLKQKRNQEQSLSQKKSDLAQENILSIKKFIQQQNLYEKNQALSNDENRNMYENQKINEAQDSLHISSRQRSMKVFENNNGSFDASQSLFANKIQNNIQFPFSAKQFNEKDLYEFAFLGISKDDILQKSTPQIYAKIKLNIQNQNNVVQNEKINRLKQKIGNVQNLLRLQNDNKTARDQLTIIKDKASQIKNEEKKFISTNWQNQIQQLKNPKNVSKSLIPKKAKYNNYVKQNYPRQNKESKNTNLSGEINFKKEYENIESDKSKNIRQTQDNIQKLVKNMQILYSEPGSPIQQASISNSIQERENLINIYYQNMNRIGDFNKYQTNSSQVFPHKKDQNFQTQNQRDISLQTRQIKNASQMVGKASPPHFENIRERGGRLHQLIIKNTHDMPIDHLKAAKSLLTRNKVKDNLFYLKNSGKMNDESVNGSQKKGALSSHRDKKKQSNAGNQQDDKLSQAYASKLEKRYTSRQPVSYNNIKDKGQYSPNRSIKKQISKNDQYDNQETKVSAKNQIDKTVSNFSDLDIQLSSISNIFKGNKSQIQKKIDDMRENLRTAPIIGNSINLKEAIRFHSKIKKNNDNKSSSFDRKQGLIKEENNILCQRYNYFNQVKQNIEIKRIQDGNEKTIILQLPSHDLTFSFQKNILESKRNNFQSTRSNEKNQRSIINQSKILENKQMQAEQSLRAQAQKNETADQNNLSLRLSQQIYRKKGIQLDKQKLSAMKVEEEQKELIDKILKSSVDEINKINREINMLKIQQISSVYTSKTPVAINQGII